MQEKNAASQAGTPNKLADWPIRTLILSMGMPMVLSMVLQAVYNIVDTIFVSHMENGATAVLALTDIQQFALFAAFGLSNTLITVVAFHYGKQEKVRLRQCVRYGLLYAVGLMLFVTLLFQLFAAPIAGLFQSGDSQEIRRLCMLSMRICTTGYVFMGITVLIQGILQGFRCVFSPLILALLRLLVLPIPLCLLLLAGDRGAELVWWAFPLAECITAVIAVPILLRTFRKKTQPA